MADIPIQPNECISDEEKLLYNTWQKLIGGVLIPGQVSTRYPLGWDVDSIIRALLYNIMLNAGGGGGGVGTVTSVGSMSVSLQNLSAPNPIIAAGEIRFELQIIDITQAAAVIASAGGTLLEDVTYRITDLNWPLKNSTIETACFNTIKDEAGATKLSSFGVGYSDTGYQYQIVYDLQNDTLLEWYWPDGNQRVGRTLLSGANCIETVNNENLSCQNIWIYETNFNNLSASGNPNNVAFSKIFNSTIDFNLVGGDIFGGTIIESSVIILTSDDSFLDGCIVQPYSVITLSHNCNKCIFEQGCTVTVTGANPISALRVGINQSAIISSGVTSKSLDPNLNELQKIAAVDAGTSSIADSFATTINVSLDAGASIGANTIRFPANPIDKQVFNIAAIWEILNVTWDGNGKTVVTNAIDLRSPVQSISFHYNSSDNSYHQI